MTYKYLGDLIINNANLAENASANNILVATSSSSSTWAQIVDGYVASSAAISGLKINPNFGSQTVITSGLIHGSNIVSDGYFQIGTSEQAMSGAVRLKKDQYIVSRNNSNTADISLIGLDSSFGPGIKIGDFGIGSQGGFTYAAVGSGIDFYFEDNTDSIIAAGGFSGVNPDGGNAFTFASAFIGSTLLTIQDRLNDAETFPVIIRGQKPYASATSTNRNPGNILLDIKPAASGGTQGNIQFKVNDSLVGAIGDGYLQLGSVTPPSSTGILRMPKNSYLTARNITNTSDISLIGTDGGVIEIGSTAYNANRTDYTAGYWQIYTAQGGNFLYRTDTAQGHDTSFSANLDVLFYHTDNTTNGATAKSFTIGASNATGTGATGGNLILKPGTGTSNHGLFKVDVGEDLIYTIGDGYFNFQAGSFSNVRFVKGAANYTPSIILNNEHPGDGKACALVAGTGGTAIIFEETAPFSFVFAQNGDIVTTNVGAVASGTALQILPSSIDAVISNLIQGGTGRPTYFISADSSTGYATHIRGGAATGVSSTGGDLVIGPGSGTSASGKIKIVNATTDGSAGAVSTYLVLTINDIEYKIALLATS